MRVKKWLRKISHLHRIFDIGKENGTFFRKGRDGAGEDEGKKKKKRQFSEDVFSW